MVVMVVQVLVGMCRKETLWMRLLGNLFHVSVVVRRDFLFRSFGSLYGSSPSRGREWSLDELSQRLTWWGCRASVVLSVGSLLGIPFLEISPFLRVG